jgi:hypothetical protein
MRSIKKKRLLLLFLVVAVAASVLTYGVYNNPFDNRNPAETDANTRPYKATSEGSTFEVPGDVPKEAIKNYTLVMENEQFKIRRDEGTSNYIITLYAIINRPDQYDAYRDQLKEYKQNALDYLAGQGVNINKIDVTYEPTEAKQL